jgi:hypothetical protein
MRYSVPIVVLGLYMFSALSGCSLRQGLEKEEIEGRRASQYEFEDRYLDTNDDM